MLFARRQYSSPEEEQRHDMVRHQLAARGIRDPRVLAAMRKVPRHCFIPERSHGQAYQDHPVGIGCGQTISQPYMVAIMTELLALEPDDRVLEIGAGSGYQTAVLAELARKVISIERHDPLAETARARLEHMGYTNIHIHCGDGALGYPPDAPYNAILVTAGSPEIPPALPEQLALGGRLVIPTGSRSIQTLQVLTRTDTGLNVTHSINCVFVPLIGQGAWPEGTE